MADSYTIKDVTQDLGFLLTLTKIFRADDKGFWAFHGDNERFLYKLDGDSEGKPIVIFQDPLPKGDYYFFNPFAEGFGRKSPASSFFYKTLRVALNTNIRSVMLYVLQSILDVKENQKEGVEHSLSHVVVRMSSVVIDRKSTIYDVVDDKMIDEFKKIFDATNDELIFIPYLKAMMTSNVTCQPLTDPKWEEKFGKEIRKKTFGAFKAVLMGVLGISKPEELSSFSVKYDTDLKTAARLYTTMSVYLKLYARFNDILAEVEAIDGEPNSRAEIDLDELSSVIERFPLAYAIAKHMVQPVLPKVSANDTTTSDTSRLRLGGDTNHTGQRRFNGPPVVDDFGRTTRSGGLSIPRAPESRSRFAPPVISDAPADPFAPVVRTSNTMQGGNRGGLGFGMGNSGGGSYFGNSGGGLGFSGGGGLNFNAPSNFNTPNNRNSYFGN